MKVARLLPYSSAPYPRRLVALAGALHEGEHRRSPRRLEVLCFFIQFHSIRQGSGTLPSIVKTHSGLGLRAQALARFGALLSPVATLDSRPVERAGVNWWGAGGNSVVTDPSIWL